jgi:hypothetical protein
MFIAYPSFLEVRFDEFENMKILHVAAFAAVALANPQGKVNPGGTPGNRGQKVENDVVSGSCHDIFFIMARASSEQGNMVCSGCHEYCQAYSLKGRLHGAYCVQRA